MTLRRRVLVMIVLLSLTTLLLGLVSVSSTHERDRLFEQFDTALAQDQALTRVDGCVEDLHRQIGLLFQSGAVLRGPELEPFWSQLEDCEAKTQRLAAIERDGVASAGVTGEVSGLLTSWRQALEQMEKNDLASALTEIVTVADKLAVPLLTGTLPARQQAVRQYVEETRATYQQRSQRADLLTATASLFVFLSILLLLVSLRRLELGVRGLLGASASFTRGDLRHRVGDSGITEIDAVAQQMNLMAVELERARGELELRASELEASLTSLQEAQESMVVQEKMAALGGLVAGVAHEINTPIGVAVTAVTFARDELDQLREALKEDAPDRDELEEAIGALDEAFGLIHTNTRRAGELVASFKQVAVDRSDVKLRKVALGPWIESVRNSLTPLARRQRVALTSGVEAEPSELRLAPGLLEQVLTNLTVNSIIHAFPDTPEVASAANPLVHIALRATPESLSILVSDNGCGMSEEVQKKVFDPFFTTRRGRGGTGLGMHIVHQIVVGQLGGAVHLESTPGSGTRWTIRIPVLDGTLSAGGMEPKAPA